MQSDPAVIWGTRRITWEQLEQYCGSVMSQLKNLGIKEGDRIAICAPTSTEYIIAIFALWRMKVVVCPVNPRLPALAVTEYLSRINASLLLTTVSIKSTFQIVPIRTLHLNEIVSFDARRDFHAVGEDWHPELTQEATVIATSGSSGQTKAVVHTWGNHYYSAWGSNELIPVGAQDRWLLSLPLYHVSGVAILVRCFLGKAAIVLPQEDDLGETILKRQVTHLSLVATQLHRLLETPEGTEALKRLKYILLGGSSIPQTLIDRSKELHLPIYLSYGLTEMSSQVATGKVGEAIRSLLYRQLTVSPEGEILVKGETLCKGYIQSGRVHLPLTEHGWFKTGDLGILDNESLKVTGRRDNMFISGGENIQPEEIERVLLSIGGIVQAVVIPKEDPEFGQRPVAFVKFQEKRIPNEDLTKACAKFLPSFKVPISFYPWPEDLMEKDIKISRQTFIKRL